MLRRFLLYGLAGWATEVVFTGVASLLRRDRSATATTYLWMHPIYGSAGLTLERLSHRVGHWPKLLRPLPYLTVIYATEYSTGWLLRRALGRCPWDYEHNGLSVDGLIRLDYAPAWYVLGLLFESIRDRVLSIEQAWHMTAPSLPARKRAERAHPSAGVLQHRIVRGGPTVISALHGT